MADTTLIDALVDLFHAAKEGADQSHANVRALLRNAKYGTPEHEAFWHEAHVLARQVAAAESRRCAERSPSDPVAASVGRRRLRKAMEQMYAPTTVERAAAEKLTADSRRHCEDLDARRRLFHADRVARGLPATPGDGESVSRVLVHPMPMSDAIEAMFARHEHFHKIGDAIRAEKVRQNDATLGGLPLGHSRIGGVPDLPPGVAWPTLDGKFVPFIAQFNLADFPATHEILPAEGHLFAFVLAVNDYAYRPPPTFVFLHRSPASALVRAARPIDDDEVFLDAAHDGLFHCYPVTSTPDRAVEIVEDEDEDPARDAALGQIFGAMHDYYGTPGETADYELADGDDWIVLMEIGSNDSMQWSDCGSLYLLIRRTALARLDFSRVLAAVCSS